MIPEASSPVELGVYGLFSILMLREVLRFVKDLMGKRGAELSAIRAEMVTELAEMKKGFNQLFSKIELSIDREQRFHDREWPALQTTVQSNTNRITAVESGLVQVQTKCRKNHDQ